GAHISQKAAATIACQGAGRRQFGGLGNVTHTCWETRPSLGHTVAGVWTTLTTQGGAYVRWKWGIAGAAHFRFRTPLAAPAPRAWSRGTAQSAAAPDAPPFPSGLA